MCRLIIIIIIVIVIIMIGKIVTLRFLVPSFLNVKKKIETRSHRSLDKVIFIPMLSLLL